MPNIIIFFIVNYLILTNMISPENQSNEIKILLRSSIKYPIAIDGTGRDFTSEVDNIQLLGVSY